MGKNLVLSQKCHPFAAHFDQRRYLTKLIKSRASARPEHKADRRARANVHDEQHRKPHREHQKKAAAKRLLHTLFLPCAPILRHERGDRGAAAVAERVGKALDARVFARCGITPNLKFSTMDSLATYSMVVAGLGLAMNNALNGRAFAGASFRSTRRRSSRSARRRCRTSPPPRGRSSIFWNLTLWNSSRKNLKIFLAPRS